MLQARNDLLKWNAGTTRGWNFEEYVMVAAGSEKGVTITVAAHREGRIRHPRVKGTWSSRFVMSSFACHFYIHDRRNELPFQIRAAANTL